MTRTRECLLLFALLALTFLIRCAHLLTNNYPICNPDSFFFMWQSRQPSIPIIGSGLTYAIKYTGMIGAILIPPLLGVLTAILVWYAARKMYGPKTALASVFTFSCCSLAYVYTIAGNIDRDCVSMLLITLGCILWYFGKDWRHALAIAVVCMGLYVEWSAAGILILMGILAVSWIVECIIQRKLVRVQMVAVLVGIALSLWPLVSYTLIKQTSNLLSLNSQNIAELRPLSILELLPYTFLLFPLSHAMLLIWKRHSKPDLFLMSWVGASLLMGLVTARFSIFMVPAVCAMTGVGFVKLWRIPKFELKDKKWLQWFSIIFLLISGGLAYNLPRNPILISSDWVDACTWVKENTPADTKIVSWWDFGYQIQDLSDREPIINGGNQGMTSLVYQVALIYSTDNDQQVIDTMKGLGAQYIMFSRHEKQIWLSIVKNSGIKSDDALYKRWLRGDVSTCYCDDIYLVYLNKSIGVLTFNP